MSHHQLRRGSGRLAVQPAGTVEYRRNRWWRWGANELMDLITPRGHDDNMWPWTIALETRYRKCAAQGCYICRDILQTQKDAV